MSWLVEAPSNIALIKYMGKKNEQNNLPMNPSLSYTLPHLFSSVMLETYPGKKDLWEPLPAPGGLPFSLSEAAQERFLQHLAHLKAEARYEGSFVVRSCNNFPHGAGLASSASSFAALTQCAFLALSELNQTPLPSMETQAQWSRLGSGSSCRSFFSPWALWNDDQIKPIEIPYKALHHQVIVISHHEKTISSSEAHQRIHTSPLFLTRPLRAQEHLSALLTAFDAQDWDKAHHLCWQEFQDMHALFSSCAKPFSYITAQTQSALNRLQELWQRQGDGPLITMDAGPNIHLLYRPDQIEMAEQFKQEHLMGHYDVL